MILKLFRVELIYRLSDADCPARNKFDKKLRLLEAPSEREAYQKALVAATKELEQLNKSSFKPGTQWEFVGLEDFHSIEKKVSDRELFYTIENDEDACEYVRQLRFKNDSLQTQIAQTA